MADYGLFIGWGQDSVRGREAKSLEVFNESIEYWGRLQQEGRIESFEVAFLEPHGGDLGGRPALGGDEDARAAVGLDDGVKGVARRGPLLVENLGVGGAAVHHRPPHALPGLQD